MAIAGLMLLGMAHVFAGQVTLTLAVENGGWGTCSPGPGTYNYESTASTTVWLTASAQTDYTYYWLCTDLSTGETTRLTGSQQLVMNKSYNVTLVFESALYSLTVTSPVTGGTAEIVQSGTTALNPDRIPLGRMVWVKATPSAGYTFVRWEPQPSTVSLSPSPVSAEASVYIDRNIHLTPVFSLDVDNLFVVSVDPVGRGGVATPAGHYASAGDSVPLSAVANAGFAFDKWVVNKGAVTIAAPNSNTATATLGAPASDKQWQVTAQFKVADPDSATILVKCDIGGRVTVITSGTTVVVTGGDTEPLLAVGNNEIVRLTAATTDASRYTFIRWEGDEIPAGDATKAEINVQVRNATTVRACFEPRGYNFSVKAVGDPFVSIYGTSKVEAVGTGSGGAALVATTSSGTNRRAFQQGLPFTLTATADPGYYVKTWRSLDITLPADAVPRRTTATYTGVMPASPVEVEAVFEKYPESHLLNLAATAGGIATASGTFTDPVSGAVNDVTFQSDGSATYHEGTVVTLSATAAQYYVFNGWTGAGVASPNSANTTVEMSEARTVMANFLRSQSTLTLVINPAGSGSIVDNATGTAPGSVHSVATVVALKPVAAPGYVFEKWLLDGNEAGIDVPLNVAMSTDRVVTAVFKTKYNLTLTINPAGSANLAGQGSGSYTSGAVINIGVAPNGTWIFDKWSGDVSGIAPNDTTTPASIVMNSHRAITANMVQGVTVRVTASGTAGTFNPTTADALAIKASGNFYRSGASVPSICEQGGGTDNAYIKPGSTIALSAPATAIENENPKWRFVRWETTANPGVALGSSYVVGTANVTLRAVYSDQRVLTANVDRGGVVNPAGATLTVGSQVVAAGTEQSLTYSTAATNISAPGIGGFVFTGWSGQVNDTTTTSQNNTVTMNADKPVTAIYKLSRNLTTGLVTIPAGVPLDFASLVTVTDGVAPLAGTSPHVLADGTTVTLTAQSSTTAGGYLYKFKGWYLNGQTTGDVDNASATLTVTMNADRTVTAVYARQCEIVFAVAPNGLATGVTNPAGTAFYDYGSQAAFSATGDFGSVFDTWTASPAVTLGAGPNSASNHIDNITGNYTLTARFKLMQNALTARILVDGSAPVETAVINQLTITANGTVLRHGDSREYNYFDLATATAATPAAIPGYRFTTWQTSGVLNTPATDNPAQLTMNGPRTLTANYVSLHTLALSVETRPGGAGTGGTVSASGNDSMSGGNYVYVHGSTATLTATPNSGFTFLGWSIDGSATLTNASTIVMSASRTATAVFARQYTLTLAVTPAGAGTTTPTIGAITTCYYGQVVTIRTTAGSGYTFSHWASSLPASALASASAATTTITIAGDTTATANYTANAVTLKLDINVDGAVKPATFTDLSITANGDIRYSTQTKSYSYNATANLSATPSNTVYRFTGWSTNVTPGVPATNGAATIGLGTTTVTANYKTLHTVRLETQTLPSGAGGSATAAGYDSETIPGSAYVYTHGSSATFTATAALNHRFLRWEIHTGGSATPTDTRTTPVLTLAVNENLTVRAVFALEYTIAFKTDPTFGGGVIVPGAETERTCYHGEVIQLAATANTGSEWSFAGWTATGGSTFANASDAATTATILGNGVITGHFTLAGTERNLTINIKVDGSLVDSTHPLTVAADGSTVPGSTAPTALHSTQSKLYYPGDTAALDASVSASLATQYAFFAWEDLADDATIATRTVPMSGGARTLTALYKSRVILSMQTSPSGVGITEPAVGLHYDRLRGDSVTIKARLEGAQLDTYVFREWTVDTGTPARSPYASETTTDMDPAGTTKTVTAHFDPGYRLDLIVKYETSPTPDTAPRIYAEATGSRTSRANGAGNQAGIVNVDINTYLDSSVDTIVQGGTVTIRATAAAGYEFKGWERDGVIISTSTQYTLTMAAATTLKAVFDKIRVTLEVYTNPANDPRFLGECTNGLRVSVTGAEPKVYQFFWGQTASLHAENNDTERYYFAGWRDGVGMGTVISGSLDCTITLTDSVTRVTALFLPRDGDYLLYIYVNPDEKDHPYPLTHPLITAVKAGTTYSFTYTVDEEGHPVYIASVPSGTISILGDMYSGGWSFHHWEPVDDCTVSNFGNRNENVTTFTHTVAQGLDPLPIVKILAVYADIPGYLLTLRAVFDDSTAATPGYIIGQISSTSTSFDSPWLRVFATQFSDSQIFENGHFDTFAPNNTFLENTTMQIAGWDYDVGSVRKVTGAPGNSFTTDPGTAGVSEVVTVHITLNWNTVSLRPTAFEQPASWSIPTTGFDPSGSFPNNSTIYDTYFTPRIITPPLAPYKWQGQRVRNSSAPTLSVGGGSGADAGNYRFKHWTTNWGNTTQRTLTGGSAAWPLTLTQDREAGATFIRLMPVELRIVAAGGSTSQDKAIIPPPPGDPNAEGIEVTASSSNPNPPVRKYDYMRQISVVATPFAADFHVIKEFIIEQDRDNNGTYEFRKVVPGDNSTNQKTHSFELDFPTIITVVFEKQQSVLTVNVANSIDGNTHGTVRLNNSPGGGTLSISGTFGYGTTQTLRASPDGGYTFTGWTVSPTSAANANPASSADATVFIDFTKTVTAHFARNVSLVMATNLPSSDFPKTIITPSVGNYNKLEGVNLTDGSQVNIQAGTAANWDFVRWEIVDDDNRTGPPRIITTPATTLTLKGNTTATAVYAKLIDVTVEATPITGSNDHNRVTATPAPQSGGMTAVSSNAATATATGSYRQGTEVTFTATPSTHYEFDYWRLTINGAAQPAPYPTTPTITRTITSAVKATAVFKPKNYTITVQPRAATGTLTPIAATLVGAVGSTTHNFLPPPQSTGSETWTLPYGTTVTLSTTPAAHYNFEKWTDASQLSTLGNSASAYQFTLAGDTTIIARFVRSEFFLTTALDPATTAGAITSLPLRGSNPSTHPAGATVTLTAVSNSSADFDRWTGDTGAGVTDTNPVLPLAMNADRSVTAHFVNIIRIAVSDPDPAIGRITVEGPGIRRTETGPDGITYYIIEAGTPVTITATPTNADQYQFDNWAFASGNPAGVTASDLDNSPLTFTAPSTPGESVSVSANFSPCIYSLTVEPRVASGHAEPFASAQPARVLNASGPFSGSTHNFLLTPTVPIEYKTTVLLSTDAENYYRFVRWTDVTLAADYGTSATLCAYTMPPRNSTVVALFERGLYKLTARVNPAGWGTITATPVGQHDPLSTLDTTVYAPNTRVVLEASDTPGKVFTGWSGDGTETASGRTLTLDMNADYTVTASYATAYTVTVPASLNGTVEVSGYSPYVAVQTDTVTGAKTYTFIEGDLARIEAKPESAHYYLNTWTLSSGISGAVTPDPNGSPAPTVITFAVTQNVTVAADFQPKLYKLTVTPVPPSGAAILEGRQLGSEPHNFLVTPSLERRYPTMLELATTPRDVPGNRNGFVSWKEGATVRATGTTWNFTYDRDASVTANYVRQVMITVNQPADVTPSNSAPHAVCGTVTPTLNAVRHNVATTPQTVTITAVASTGFEFAGWTGTNAALASASTNVTTATASTATLTFTINDALADELAKTGADIDITPTFKRRLYTVKISRWDRATGTPNVGGSVSRQPVIENAYPEQFYYGTQVTVTVNSASDGYRFVGWGSADNEAASREVSQLAAALPSSFNYTVTADKYITAIFNRVCILEVSTAPDTGAGTATVTSPTGFDVPGFEGRKFQFDLGTTVQLQATPEGENGFLGWLGAVSDYDHASTSITLYADQQVIARFGAIIKRQLIVNVAPSPGGRIDIEASQTAQVGAGTANPVSGTLSLLDGEYARLSVNPSPGYVFTAWQPATAVTVSDPSLLATYVHMNANKNVTARFAVAQYNLGVYEQPTGSGTVTGGGTYAHGVNATITATPGTGYVFKRWQISGAPPGINLESPTVALPMNRDYMAYAIFEPETPPAGRLTVTVFSDDTGTRVENSLAAIVGVSTPDSDGYTTITITPIGGYKFASWGGPDDGDLRDFTGASPTSIQTAKIRVSSDKDIEVTLGKSFYVLDWVALPGGAGAVSLSGGEPFPGSSTARRYLEGTTVIVVATAIDGWEFLSWSGNVASDTSTTPNGTILLNSDATVTANFREKPPRWNITVSFDNSSVRNLAGGDRLYADTSVVFSGTANHFPVAQNVRINEEYSDIGCDIADSLNYYFDHWKGIPPGSGQSTGSGSSYSHQRLYVTGHINARAVIHPTNPILEVTLVAPGDAHVDDRSRLISNGGEASFFPSILTMGMIVTITVDVKSTYALGSNDSDWEITGASVWLGPPVSVLVTNGEDTFTQVKRDIQILDIETKVKITLTAPDDGIYRRNTVEGAKDLHDDVSRTKSPGNYIDGTPISRQVP